MEEYILAIIASLPGILALIRQIRLEREEKNKIIAETKNIDADATLKIVGATSELQESYIELLRNIKNEAMEFKKETIEMSKKLKFLEEKLEETQKANEELMRQNILLQSRVEKLEIGINLLITQIKSLGYSPVFIPNNEEEKEDAV